MSKSNLLYGIQKGRDIKTLRRLQSLPLNQKILLSQKRISEFVEKTKGNVYVSFSGGKDSTVLLHLVRTLYPECLAIFSDTGLEFPEIRDFVKTVENVNWVKPKISFKQVIEKYGFPVVSKEVSAKVYEIRNTKSEYMKNKRLYGDAKGNGKMSEKWKFLVDAPFKCSSKCCDKLKKEPLSKIKGLYPIVGTMANESMLRLTKWVRFGCNMFTGKIQSNPLSFWTEEDIWKYLIDFNVPYSKIYDMGYKRTGCIFCMFGLWSEDRNEKNRFERLRETHPNLFKYCMKNLEMEEVIKYIDSKVKKPTNTFKTN